MLLLGLALSIAEEFIIQQTSLAPMPFPGSHPEYGRIWGVNLVYLLFMLGYESVWVVLVPVQLTELFFPVGLHSPGCGNVGLLWRAWCFYWDAASPGTAGLNRRDRGCMRLLIILHWD